MAAEPRIGTKIRRARERKRLRQEDVARQLGVSRTTYDSWENNRAYPRSSIGALEELLEVDLTQEPVPAPGDAEQSYPPEFQEKLDELGPEERQDLIRILEKLTPAERERVIRMLTAPRADPDPGQERRQAG